MKFDEIRTTVLMKDIDIFVCTETWLNDKHEESLFAIPGFNCFREDRCDHRLLSQTIHVIPYFSR